jgi:KDO2-lipid IV(A) lauroyltransferase
MFAIKLISKLPFAVLYGVSDFLFFLSYHLIKYRRKLVWKNLTNSFPSKTDLELRKIEKQFYKNLCDYAVELIKLLTITEKELSQRMKFNNPEAITRYLHSGQSVINLASHHFNWEWLLTGGSIVLPAQMDFVYQPVSSKFFDDFSYQCRSRFGAYGITRKTVAREVVKRRDIVKNIAIVGDQYPGYGHDKKYHATFLHQPTVFFNGPNQLAQLTQYPVTYHAVRKIKRGYYECTIVELAVPPYGKEVDVLEHYIREVEKVIHEDPAGWLWSHNRWKTRHLQNEQSDTQSNI